MYSVLVGISLSTSAESAQGVRNAWMGYLDIRDSTFLDGDVAAPFWRRVYIVQASLVAYRMAPSRILSFTIVIKLFLNVI